MDCCLVVCVFVLNVAFIWIHGTKMLPARVCFPVCVCVCKSVGQSKRRKVALKNKRYTKVRQQPSYAKVKITIDGVDRMNILWDSTHIKRDTQSECGFS